MTLSAFELNPEIWDDGDPVGTEIPEGDPGFPVILGSTFTPGVSTAEIRVAIDPTVNTSFVVVATDLCGNTPCAADPNPPRFFDFQLNFYRVDVGWRAYVIGTITDFSPIAEAGFFILDNMTGEFNPPFIPGSSTEVHFRVENEYSNRDGNFGMFATDACNAFVFDPAGADE